MTLQEIFDQLTYGELSQLSMGGGEAGAITEDNHLRVLAHINLGLTDLYKRFHLKEGRVLLELVTSLTSYALNSKFARANTRSREATRYLVDSTAAPFQDDVLKIERVLTKAGVEFNLNNHDDEYSMHTSSATTLRVPEAVVSLAPDLPTELKTSFLELVYRASHPKIVKGLGLFDPTRIQVQLPESHLNALLLFVASRANTPTGIVGEFNPGNNYAMKYEAECMKLTEMGLQIDQGGGYGGRFHARGFV